MEISKWGALAGAGLLLVCYNFAQPGINELRNNRPEDNKAGTTKAKPRLMARRFNGLIAWRALPMPKALRSTPKAIWSVRAR